VIRLSHLRCEFRTNIRIDICNKNIFNIICLVSGSALAIPLPIIASNPHFLAADRSVQDAVNGLIPDEILHRSYMDIEPTTGSK
jgi:hypothetical protein